MRNSNSQKIDDSIPILKFSELLTRKTNQLDNIIQNPIAKNLIDQILKSLNVAVNKLNSHEVNNTNNDGFCTSQKSIETINQILNK